MLILELSARVLCALLLGGLIGAERQWRARLAGLRTNALVSLGAALFVLMGAYAFGSDNADPTRVAAQIVSGIGFLGAGVIMRDGLSLRGLNTAATLWCAAAIGALCGGGMYLIAGAGCLAVIGVNVLLRPLGYRIEQQTGAASEIPSEYEVSVECERDAVARIRLALIAALPGPVFSLGSLDTEKTSDERFRIAATLWAHKPRDAESRIEAAVATLLADTSVFSARWRHPSTHHNQ